MDLWRQCENYDEDEDDDTDDEDDDTDDKYDEDDDTDDSLRWFTAVYDVAANSGALKVTLYLAYVHTAQTRMRVALRWKYSNETFIHT